MTHEPIHTVHLTPHIAWQGTRAELEAMQKEGWPLGGAKAERIKELEAKLADQIEWVKRLADDLIAAEGREARLKEKLAKAVEALVQIVGKKYYADDPWGIANATLAELKGDKP